MKLTGKAKEDFNKWFDWYSQEHHDADTDIFLDEITLPDTLINALIIEWLDSVDIYIQIELENIDGIFSSYIFYGKNNLDSSEVNSKSRQKATEIAIEIANEIYNTVI